MKSDLAKWSQRAVRLLEKCSMLELVVLGLLTGGLLGLGLGTVVPLRSVPEVRYSSMPPVQTTPTAVVAPAGPRVSPEALANRSVQGHEVQQ